MITDGLAIVRQGSADVLAISGDDRQLPLLTAAEEEERRSGTPDVAATPSRYSQTVRVLPRSTRAYSPSTVRRTFTTPTRRAPTGIFLFAKAVSREQAVSPMISQVHAVTSHTESCWRSADS